MTQQISPALEKELKEILNLKEEEKLPETLTPLQYLVILEKKEKTTPNQKILLGLLASAVMAPKFSRYTEKQRAKRRNRNKQAKRSRKLNVKR